MDGNLFLIPSLKYANDHYYGLSWFYRFQLPQ